MKLKVVLAVAAIAVLSSAAGGGAWLYWKTQTSIQDAVRTLKFAVIKDFHDPESARFRSVQLYSLDGAVHDRLQLVDLRFLAQSKPSDVLALLAYDPEHFHLCGEVNAKNAFGAYVGYKQFYVSGRKDPAAFIDTRDQDDFAKKMCEIGKDSVVYREPSAN
jgi:hypothetical protein